MGTLSAPALAALGLLTAASCARGDVIVYQQGQSPQVGYQHLGSTIYQGNFSANLGAEPLIRVGNGKALGASDAFPFRGVLAFPLTDIPAGSTINGISLRMAVDSAQTSGAGVGTIELHQ